MGLDCFDTNVLVQLVQAIEDPNTPYAPDLLAYLQEVEEGKHTPILPVPVIAEYLVRVPENKWSEVVQFFRETFRIYELNLRASLEAAQLMRVKLEKEGRLGSGEERECVRTDAFILGIAITAGCDRLFTNDGRIQGMADGRIKIENIPQADQPPLL